MMINVFNSNGKIIWSSCGLVLEAYPVNLFLLSIFMSIFI